MQINGFKIDIEVVLEDPSWDQIIGYEGDYLSNISDEINISELDKNSDQNSEINNRFLKILNEITSHIISSHESLSDFRNIAISILLANDDILQKLNKEHRDKEKPTNILSFPDNNFISPGIIEDLEDIIDDDYLYLGDLAISYQRVLFEAQEKNNRLLIEPIYSKEFFDYFLHLYVHGVLHLLGYDHVSDHDYEIMKKMEIKVLKKFGIDSPYDP